MSAAYVPLHGGMYARRSRRGHSRFLHGNVEWGEVQPRGPREAEQQGQASAEPWLGHSSMGEDKKDGGGGGE
ncbi:hypothetical protein MAPG_00896 [Magnaporthiopsis poae ATCC 64411]|uniref:Uncharacterized protein n=1 Tax=Magnaporthiopsis poae (strain ATCC 64411 / 73-15) TaxID=644358 RepID=A0A0C4DM93_MAGP6|nr:hypothetical protein MAPG_00896 [Magnaporthiopsis poae ATCC 64411]